MKWVKIEDQEPAPNQNIIAVGTCFGEITGVGESEYMGIGRWDGLQVHIDSDTYSTEIVEVTHWMPLPNWPT